MLCDNKLILHIPIFHERTKYIEINCHLTRDKLLSRLIKLSSINSTQQLVNVYTKVLTPLTFHFFIPNLGMSGYSFLDFIEILVLSLLLVKINFIINHLVLVLFLVNIY